MRIRSLFVALVALASCAHALRLNTVVRAARPCMRARPAAPPLLLNNKDNNNFVPSQSKPRLRSLLLMKVPIVDDVLDYLTNMGGCA